MAVYLIQQGNEGPVKIGYTTGDPEARLADLQTGNPMKLRLLWYFPGTKADEHSLHRRFNHRRKVGEWFDLSQPEVRAILGSARTAPERRPAPMPVNSLTAMITKAALDPELASHIAIIMRDAIATAPDGMNVGALEIWESLAARAVYERWAEEEEAHLHA